MWSSWPWVRIRPRTWLLVLLEERQVGHHQVDAQQLGLGEHHPAIDDDDVVAVADGGHVHAELAQSAQGDYLQLLISHSDCLTLNHTRRYASTFRAILSHGIAMAG